MPEQPDGFLASGTEPRCGWCGYSLRGLAAAGERPPRCPECGQVTPALRPDEQQMERAMQRASVRVGLEAILAVCGAVVLPLGTIEPAAYPLAAAMLLAAAGIEFLWPCGARSRSAGRLARMRFNGKLLLFAGGAYLAFQASHFVSRAIELRFGLPGVVAIWLVIGQWVILLIVALLVLRDLCIRLLMSMYSDWGRGVAAGCIPLESRAGERPPGPHRGDDVPTPPGDRWT